MLIIYMSHVANSTGLMSGRAGSLAISLIKNPQKLFQITIVGGELRPE